MPPTPAPAPENPVDRLEVTHEGAHAIAERGDRGWEVTMSAGTGRLDVAAGTQLLQDLSSVVADHGGGPMRWRVAAATDEHDRIARNAGFGSDRHLVQLRRSLPVDASVRGDVTDVETRPFVPGRDDDEWLRVNNAAFAWHPEQSGWTSDHLAEPLAEPWFDPDGFLLHPATGPVQGFCWTKEHRDTSPPLGEIFIIAVDPEAAGQGLGRRLVLAGLDHLSQRGLGTAMLYTEADNEPARRLYSQLGFEVHHTVTVYERSV